jgi:hypothetical protein
MSGVTRISDLPHILLSASMGKKEATMIQEPETGQQIKERPAACPSVSLAKILVATDFSETSDRVQNVS